MDKRSTIQFHATSDSQIGAHNILGSMKKISLVTYAYSLRGSTTTAYISPQIEGLVGFSPSEWLANSCLWFNQIHPDDRTRVLEDLATCEGSGKPFISEYRLMAKDGRSVWVRNEAEMGRDESGFLLLRGFLLDISPRRQAEDVLPPRDRNFRALIENSVDVITIISPEGTILYESPSIERILGYTPKELIGKNVFDYVHPDDLPHALEVVNRGITTPTAIERLEFRFRHSDRTWRHFEAVGMNLLDDPDIKGIIVSSRDNTERKRLEDMLLHSQKMETVGKLAGGIAHDLNNILSVITSYAGFVKEALTARDPVLEDIGEILKASMRATVLIRQLLAFSRHQVIQPHVVNLNDLLPDMDKMLRRLIGEDVHLVTLLSPNLGSVKVDPGQIEQVIVNLAVNSRDAMPHGGTLTIETANVLLDQDYADCHPGAVPGVHVMLAITDTGIGMTDEVKKHLFEPFFTTKEVGKGSGLGLATVYGIVKQHQGTIWVYSELGKGTAFKIYLPRIDETADGSPKDIHFSHLPRGHETILVVEDEKAVRQAAVRILRRLGYTIREASNGEEALSLVQNTSSEIHLLLTDVVMPTMYGKELADRLTSLRPGLKILFMSGYTNNTVMENGVLMKGMDYVQKPFSEAILAHKIRGLLDRGPAT